MDSHIVTLSLANQQRLTYVGAVQTPDVVYRTCQKRWKTDGERKSQGTLCYQHYLRTVMILLKIKDLTEIFSSFPLKELRNYFGRKSNLSSKQL